MPAFLFFLQVVFFSLLSRWLLHHTRDLISSNYFSAGLGYKLLAGWLIGWLYTSYYKGGDTWAYYQDAAILTDLFWDNPLHYLEALLNTPLQLQLKLVDQPRALLFAKFSSILGIFSMNNYWLISLSYSAISFFSAWWFMASLKRYFELRTYQVFIPFLLYPSVAIWSSGLLKESLTLALIYLLVGYMLHFYFRPTLQSKSDKLKALISFLLSFVLWKLKYYYAAILIPSLAFLLLLKLLNTRKRFRLSHFKSRMIASIVFIALLLIAMESHPNLNPNQLFKALVLNHNLTVAASIEGSYIEFSELQPEAISLVKYLPKAVLNGLFAPLPVLQGTNVLHLLAGLENLFLLIFTGWALVNWAKNRFHLKQPDILVICLFYIFTLAWLITIASPNFGSLIRYRVAYMPFFLFLILLALENKLNPIFSQFRKKT